MTRERFGGILDVFPTMADDSDPLTVGADAATSHGMASLKSGDVSKEAVKGMVVAGASAAGGAACAALGAPELAPLCATIAGKIAGPFMSWAGDVFGNMFGGPDPYPWGVAFDMTSRLLPVVQGLQQEGFVALGYVYTKLRDGFALSNLPGPYDPFAVLRFLGVPLVPTNKVHRYIDGYPTPNNNRVGPFWNYVVKKADGTYPRASEGEVIRSYRWGYDWMPPEWENAFIEIERVTNSGGTAAQVATLSRLLLADMVAWRKTLGGATMLALGELGAAAAAAEVTRQIAALKLLQHEQADQATLIALAEAIAFRRESLRAIGRGVTDGVSFLRFPPPMSAADQLRALQHAGFTSAAQLSA